MKKNYSLKKLIPQNILLWCLVLLFNYSALGQTLNFTIDTAIDNGTSITETLTNGADTYVLTVFHSGNEELDNLGGGDLIFYLSAIDPLTPHNLSITKNGQPTNFKLNGIDYDTLGAGTISLTNQDGNFISTPTAYPLGAGALAITNSANASDVTVVKINPTNTNDLNNFGFHNINIDILNTLSVDEITALEEEVAVFPNPSNGNITIKNSGVAINEIVITDVNGRKVSTHNLNGITTNKDLDLSSVLSSGLYFITISSENTSTVKKLIIK